ncbi:MAG: OB-fold nucleic acid binding domain-containing protein, partial [bacterium]
HVGGFVLTDKPLCESVPITNAAMEDRTVIEWDKDDIEAVGMLKVDVLGLGMLTCLRKCFELVEQHDGEKLTLASVPEGDPDVYTMISNADTVGVFQIESRAQMSMLPRLRPQCFYDLVIEVAIVRPGPIQGDMVHPYLRRRCGEEAVEYPDEVVKQVLSKTLGVPLFQEQAMSLAIHCAGFTPDEADQLRRAMAAWKRKGDQIHRFERKLIDGMTSRGYSQKFAQQCFERIRGFSEYGFPESHAASFALLVYVSVWLKHHYPAVYVCALLNSQPMGFYAPAQLVRDAQNHGVEVRPVDVNHSQWNCTLEAHEGDFALRLGMRQVSGLRETDAHAIAEAVTRGGPFRSIEALWRNSSVPVAALCHLAEADAFRSMGLDRQHALWHLYELHDADAPLFKQAPQRIPASENSLPAVPELRKVTQDYASLGLSLKQHPMAFLRPQLDARQIAAAEHVQDARRSPHGTPVTVAGLCLLRQRPATGKGVIFMTLEDETGQVNLIVYPDIYQPYRAAARDATVMLAQGSVQRQDQVVHVMVRSIKDLSAQVAELAARSRDFH